MRWTECTGSRRLWSANSEKQRACRILTTNPAIPRLVVCDQRWVATANFYQLERCRLAVKSASLRRRPLQNQEGLRAGPREGGRYSEIQKFYSKPIDRTLHLDCRWQTCQSA